MQNAPSVSPMLHRAVLSCLFNARGLCWPHVLSSSGLRRACWDRFVDEQTPVVRQYYQVFQDGPQGNSGQPITAPTNISLQSTSAVVTGLQLQVCSTWSRPANIGQADCHYSSMQPGQGAQQEQSRPLTVSSHAQYGESYYVVISAVNAAGLVGIAKSQDVSIEHESENLPPAKVAGIVLAAVLGTGAAVAALTIWITRRRCMPCAKPPCPGSVHAGMACMAHYHAEQSER